MNFTVLKAIFDSMEQGVVFIDDQSRIAYMNPAARKMRNVNMEKTVGKSILECHPVSSHQNVLNVIEALRTGKAEGHHRMNIEMMEGRFYDNTYSVVWGPQKQYLGVVVVTQDVTERRQAVDQLNETLKKLQQANEELKSLDRKKDDFFSNVSHELKTPMISVMGYVGMILKEKFGPLADPQRKVLETSYRNLLKLGKNIDALLDLAAVRIQGDGSRFEPVDLSKVIEFACATVDPLAREHQIDLEIQLPPEPVTVFGVEEKLDQLFDNLLTNAIKYNRQGGKIGINLRQDSGVASTRITDTGVGISHQSLPEIFTRHFQDKTKPLGNARGLGIGLSLVQEIIKLHHGEIGIETETGKGTTFVVKLPVNRRPAGEKDSPSAPR